MQNRSSFNFIQENYILILIILLGAVLRIYHLGGESVWLDEAITSWVAELNIHDLFVWLINKNDNNPPLYYMFMHFWVSLFGHSEFSLRFPSVIFGTGSIFMIYKVGRLLLSKSASLIAALVLTVSVFHVEYSQEARAYSLLAFLTLCSFYFYLRTLSGSRAPYTIGYVAVSVLLVYSHFYGVFIIIVQNVFCLTRYFTSKDVFSISLGRWILLQLIIGFLFIPGLLLWYKNTVAIQSGFWLPEPTIVDLAKYSYHFTGRNYILCVVIIILAVLSIVTFRNLGDSKDRLDISDKSNILSSDSILSSASTMYLLLLWLLLPVLVPFIISHISTPILHSRYIIGSSLALYLMVAWGICNLRSKTLTLLIPLVILLLSVWPLRMYYVEDHKYQWREAVSYLESSAKENDSIFVYPGYDVQTTAYYKERGDLSYIALTEKSAGDLPDRFWVVIGLFSDIDEEDLKNLVLDEYDLKPVKSFSRLDLYLYQRD